MAAPTFEDGARLPVFDNTFATSTGVALRPFTAEEKRKEVKFQQIPLHYFVCSEYDRYATTSSSAYATKNIPKKYQQIQHVKAPCNTKVSYVDVTKLPTICSQTQLRVPVNSSLMVAESPSAYKSDVMQKHIALDHERTRSDLKQQMENTSMYQVQVLHPADRHFLSTQKQDYVVFSKNRLNGYAKKDALTIWECENYPKAWGHGLKQNPIHKYKPQRTTSYSKNSLYPFTHVPFNGQTTYDAISQRPATTSQVSKSVAIKPPKIMRFFQPIPARR